MGFDTKTDQISRDQLVLPDFPVLEYGGTIITGAALSRGSVLGKITASGKYTLCDKDAVDGSEVPVAVLMDYVDAAAADKEGPIAVTGQFIEESLIFADGTAIADLRDTMWSNNLYTKALAVENA